MIVNALDPVQTLLMMYGPVKVDGKVILTLPVNVELNVIWPDWNCAAERATLLLLRLMW